MTDLRKAAEMALEALENIHSGNMTPMAEESWNKAMKALRQALAQSEQDYEVTHNDDGTFSVSLPEGDELRIVPPKQPEQECIYPECETGIGCDGPCGEKPVDTVKQEPAVYKCPRCATSMDVDLNAKPVDTINTSQERETAKRRHEPVGYIDGAYGGYAVFTPVKPAAVYPDKTALYTAPPKREWVGLTDEDCAECVQVTAASGSAMQLIAAIEAKLKEKNT